MCKFCNGEKKKIENGYTYGRAYIESTNYGYYYKLCYDNSGKNMERESLKSIIALSAVESWWKNETSKRMAHLRQVWCGNRKA